jgi:magnesium-transporting ATPase (P-type)
VADPTFQQGISELEQPNLIFAGTSVASGTGRAVIYATGMLTQFGRIAHLTQSVKEEPSQFQLELSRLTKVITWFAFGVGALILIASYSGELILQKKHDVILLTLGIIVAAIPEGLPATLTIALAMAGQRLAQKGVLAKKLSIIETLGTVSVICTDKSGTLTQNQMTVKEIWVSRQRIKVAGVGYEPQGRFSPSPEEQPWGAALTALLEAANSCNNSRLNEPTPEQPTWSSLGDQTEVALKVTAMKAGLKEKVLNLLYPRVHEIPFDARRKRMTTIHRTPEYEVAFVKGSPREVLQLCTQIQIDSDIVPLTDELRAEVMAANDEYARNALRVLAMAKRDLPTRTGPYSPESVERELTFLGLQAMMDPPRPEVEQAIKTCRQAGIRIVMITGDYGLTAESLARRVGMLSTPNPRIITGAEVEEMSEIELQKALEAEVLFARMAPEHKLRLVSAFQSHGDVVAVTGDGVNDAPALRKADVGIAMGIVGTDVAKEAADIILTNDNFGAIVYAIEEGRAIFDNIRKFITYIFSSNVPEILPFVISASFAHIPLALNVRQILAIDLGTDILPAVALGVEKPEPDVMQKPPRLRQRRLIDNGLLIRSFLWLGLIEAAMCYVGFFSVYLFSGNADLLEMPFLARIPFPSFLRYPLTKEQVEIAAVTVFHAGVVMSQVGNAFACRSETTRGKYLGWRSNKYLLIAMVAEIIGIVTIIYWEPLARQFDHAPIPVVYWIGLSIFSLVIYSIEWIRKRIVRGTRSRYNVLADGSQEKLEAPS